ncbi:MULTISPECIES: hypothetical protein [unclassified Halomonas]|uniref:hypothetical protein n=1 Tax=unclassified Halomonas TaxID=2609666 RepID=UPI001C970A3E|nr:MULTISPECIES: hypothetical protein [unclassified Halomonas]MBY5925388.1 hypothetical protein [Halomonas sp. DP4Y7-2]MBY6232429.1 hypothetical protein [Halomonas sp. DP4Y7-1]
MSKQPLGEKRPIFLSFSPVVLVGGLSLAVLLAGCQEGADGESANDGQASSSAQGRFIEAPESAAGETIEGELTSQSGVNLNNGSRFGSHWVCGSEGAGELYQLDSPFAATLSVYDERGRWQGGAESSEQAPASLLLGPSEGCSLVVVNSTDMSGFGPYALTPSQQQGAESLTDGEAVVGVLGEETASYPISLDDTRQVTLTLAGASSAALVLEGNDASHKAARCGDDQQTLEAFLTPGDYEVRLVPGQPVKERVDVACEDDFVSVGGGYRLTMEQADLSRGERNSGPLRSGDSITGTLDDASSSNTYELSIAEPTNVTLSLSSDDFDTVLQVRGGQTNIDVDDTGSGTNSLLESVLMPGDYRVVVTGYGGESGAYALELDTTPFDGELKNDGELVPGESVQGMAGGMQPNTYTLTIEQASEVSIGVSSSAFDTQLYLEGNGVALSDDDGGGGTNSRIDTVLEPGSYRVEVSSYSGSSAGTFLLESSVNAFDGELRNSGELQSGETVRGMLGSSGSNGYTFTLDEAAEVTLELNSSAFDALLGLSGGSVDTSDDDGGSGTNSRIHAVLEPGTYQVSAQSFSGSGSYSLRLTQQPFSGDFRTGGEIRTGETVYGQLEVNGELTYTLVVEEAGVVSVETQSEAVDTLLELEGNGVFFQDDDSGSTDLGSLIETTLEPGEYQVSVTGYGGNGGIVRVDVRP